MKRVLTCTVLLFVLTCEVLADQITLKNGDRVTGKIVKTDGGKLVVTTDLLGDVNVDLGVATNITTDQPVYVTLEDGRTVAGALTATAGKVELRPANANTISVERSAMKVIRSEAEYIAY